MLRRRRYSGEGNLEHIEVVKGGKSNIDRWREKEQATQLPKLDIRGASITNDLPKANLAGADCRGVVFEGVDLREAVFDRADLHLAEFHDCDLRGAFFEGADIDEVDFGTSNLVGASFRDVEKFKSVKVGHAVVGDGLGNPALQLHARRDAFIQSLRARHPLVAAVLLVTCNHGRWPWLLLVWSLVALVVLSLVALDSQFVISAAERGTACPECGVGTDEPVARITKPRSIWEAGYLCIVTATTLGYGDIAPVDARARACCLAGVLLGYLLLGLLVTLLTNLLAPQS